jgi:hypothetical protein
MTCFELAEKENPLPAEASFVQVERMVIRQRQFLEAIEPYIKLKVDMHNLALPVIIAKPDGEIEHTYNFTDEQLRTLDQLDELIENARSKYLGV